MRPNYYGNDGDQDRAQITSHKAWAQPPPKKKYPKDYKKKTRQQLQAPTRKTLSLLPSESLAYEEESDSDNNEKGPTEDRGKRGRQMAATSVNQGRREERHKDDNIHDMYTNKIGQEQ